MDLKRQTHERKTETLDRKALPPLKLDTLKDLIEEAKDEQVSIYAALKEIDIRYLRKESVNQGGMKTILKAEDRRTGRKMAMAILKNAKDLSSIENFLREARITAHLEHPNIVPVYDIGLDADQQPFFTMKLLSGNNLREILEKLSEGDEDYIQKYPLSKLLEIFCKVLDAVEYAHASGIIHLDLKPSNIQVSDYGEVLVCDWGLAKIVDSDCDGDYSLLDDTSLYSSCVNFLTVDGFFKGTPGFMAPEQTRGRLAKKDNRTDNYSLGSILYTLLTHKDPIVGKNVDEILAHTREGQFERPRLRCPNREIPASLEAIVMKAMARNPENRYRSAARMHRDIAAYCTGFATRAEEAGFFTQLRLLIRRNPKVSITIAVASLLITGVVTYTNEELRFNERTARQAQQDAEINLAKYKREREWRTRNEAAPDYYNRALENYKSFRLNDAMEQVGIALDYDPRLYRAWELKGHLHFAFMEFKQAADAYKKAESPTANNSSNLARKFSKIHRNAQGRVSADNLLKLVADSGSKKRSAQVRYMIRTYMQYELPLRDRLQLVRGLSKAFSADAKNYNFKYQERPEGLYIDLSRNKEPVLTEFLTGLPIIHLNLSGSTVKDLSPLRGMPLQVLDLSRSTGLSSLGDLVGMQIDVLNISQTEIQRIEALRGMHFQLLDISSMRRANTRWLEMLRRNCIIQTLVLSKNHYNSPALIEELEGWTLLVDKQ